ncbi:MAG TPA: hypothetical protein HPP56_10350, partial [Nitrospirae bacterium]|nr:hypothetical protein [Nitrospirota bacterium]
LALAEITSVKETEAEIKLLTKVEDNINDSLFKIPRSKIKALFFQGDINWYLADSYYQMLKDSGRFELIDSTMETLDMSKLSEEASKKEVDLVIIIDSDKKTDVTSIRQKLYWGKDFKAISDKTIILKPGYVQSLMTKALPLITSDSNILLTYQVPNTIKKIALADLNGDGSPDIILATENSFSIYQPSTDLKLLWDFSNFTSDQLLWIDSIDIDMSKRDSLIVTAYKDGEVKTSVYKLIDNNLKELVSLRNVFMRRLGNSLIGQEYSRSQGFESKIYYYDYKDGKLVRGAAVIIPEKVNLYDFSPIESPDGKKGLIVWDDKGFLTLYSSSGIISWRSAEDFGGFTTKIKRESPIFMIDRGEWSVKDRLVQKGGGVLAPKRKPLFGMAKGLGYKESEIKVLWWNGLSVEQITLIDKLDGEILDYGLLNDRLLVLCKPLMGIKPLNVLKGSNPFLNTLYVISVKGFYN